ncbi:MAG: hypothetical protein CM1200mP28_14490 [Deltaproteobacteria bacterium]|nr:MAG: hypothetical protein CM1200mP28_14490 [Deltaproteobacteria bacterium]
MLGILFAVRVIISQLYGAGNSSEISANVIQGLWLSQALALIASAYWSILNRF